MIEYSAETIKDSKICMVRFNILNLIQYCRRNYCDSEIEKTLFIWVPLKKEFFESLKVYDDTGILNFGNIEEFLNNTTIIDNKSKLYIKRKIKLLTIKSKL